MASSHSLHAASVIISSGVCRELLPLPRLLLLLLRHPMLLHPRRAVMLGAAAHQASCVLATRGICRTDVRAQAACTQPVAPSLTCPHPTRFCGRLKSMHCP